MCTLVTGRDAITPLAPAISQLSTSAKMVLFRARTSQCFPYNSLFYLGSFQACTWTRISTRVSLCTFLAWLNLLLWRRMQGLPSKRQWTSIRQHGITSQKTCSSTENHFYDTKMPRWRMDVLKAIWRRRKLLFWCFKTTRLPQVRSFGAHLNPWLSFWLRQGTKAVCRRIIKWKKADTRR